ncbi:alpha/beta hydrolase-fold protein [Microbispora corallina]|uniref:Esterase n=1 Tax=Microbispora corallina TaxID=83302 RepID=A0ABQ4G4F3_9ACTN|nr:esterase [Microbispora corallina]
MDLTATKVQALFAVIAIAAFAATVWLWPRLSRPTVGAIAARIGVLLLDQVLLLTAIGVVINAYFGFYGSWGDLFGTDDTAAPPITMGGAIVAAGPSSPIRVLGSKPVFVDKPRPGTKGGRIEQVVIKGARTGISSPAYVYLPPQYFDKKYATRRFPVILALTGYPGDALNLITRLDLPSIAAESILAHQIPPTIMVLMRPTVVPPRDTECQDVPGGPQAETFFTADLRQAMEAGFRVGTEAANWGVLGGSTGGYCALKMSMRHPEAFSAAVSLSGYFHALVDMTTGDLFGGSSALQNENDLMWRLAHLPSPPISVLVTTSRHGEADYASTEKFLAAVKPPMQAASLILPSGGHNFATWERELPQALPWLAQQLHAPPQVTAPNAAAAAARPSPTAGAHPQATIAAAPPKPTATPHPRPTAGTHTHRTVAAARARRTAHAGRHTARRRHKK